MGYGSDQHEAVADPAVASPGSIYLITIAPAVGLMVSAIAFYPGYLSHDSIVQYTQALTRQFNDWHPPAMAFLWSVLDKVWTGPQLMLFAQLLLFWTGAHLWLRASAERAGMVALMPSCAMLFLPAILNFIGVIWADVQLAVTWWFAIAVVFYRNSMGVGLARTTKATLLCLVIYGGIIRHNAGLAVGPVALYVLGGRATLKSASSTIAAYIVAGLIVVFVGKGADLAIGAAHTPVVRSVILFDLNGMSVYENKPLFPFQVSDSEWERLKACRGDESIADPLVWGSCSFAWDKMLTATPTDWSAIRFWLLTAAHHPRAYIVHRLTYMRHLLSFMTPQASPFIWYPGIRKNDYGLAAPTNAVSSALKRYVDAFGSTIMFRLYAWVLAAAIVLAASFHRRLSAATADFARAASITALLYLLAYAIVGPASDFRYGYVSIILAVFGGGAIVAELAQRVLDGIGRGRGPAPVSVIAGGDIALPAPQRRSS